MKYSYNEFHVSRKIRDLCKFDERLFASSGNVLFADFKSVQKFQTKLNDYFDKNNQKEKRISAGSLNAMGLIDEVFHYVSFLFRRDKSPNSFKNLLSDLDKSFGREKIDLLLTEFVDEFPPVDVYKDKLTCAEFLEKSPVDKATGKERSNREQVLEEIIMLHLANENPAFHSFQILFDEKNLLKNPDYTKTWNTIKAYFKTQPVFGPKSNDLITMLKEPVTASPTSLKGQLDYIRTYWKDLLGEWILKLLEGIDIISEEEKAAWHPAPSDGFSMDAYSYENLSQEYERFSPDRDWMPKVVLMAKTVLVWLYQLSKKYDRDISRLDQIPDEELDLLRNEGFTGLWLIGLWERSYASKRIKQINGNPEAAASAYSLLDYEIAGNLGGWAALDNLRRRCWQRGIRLASDMVPNHTGMDGKWVVEHPDYFVSSKECPFPQYSFTGENLSQDGRVSIFLEDHYYSKTDCAVCFKRVDNQTGDVTYIYHGNDGTGMPWNDTAQIDFLNPTAREAVIQQILNVARNFPIIRFDAAMVLAKKHIRRLWYPQPGHGGDIASRSRYALSTEEFEKRIPNEFWREVVDRCAQEMPDTLLLAEAFWMMEGYFTRTLGMHRVYNSAFMNMLKKEENQKYRDTVKNTIKFDPEVLKRFVNFMNNPDEETAVAQFGKGDKYFGVCTLMITMPGLPMFGHGQLEGFEEKYGMEYTRAYKDEKVDQELYNRHCHDIFPLLHKRYLFSGVENFLFYDVWNNGSVNENVFAYSNSAGNENTIVFYNNKYERACGWIKQSCEYAKIHKTNGQTDKTEMLSKSLGDALGLTYGENNYCILHDVRSGLWFVRTSNELLDNGMFVSLNGFESQVYTDVRQVIDGEDKKYFYLNSILNGSGVFDLEVAWEEYRYKELYESLSKFITPDFVAGIKLFHAEPKLKPEEFTKSFKDNAIAYYEQEILFEKQEEELAEKSVSEDGKLKKSKVKTAKTKSAKKEALSAEQRFASFSKAIDYIATAGSEFVPITVEQEEFDLDSRVDENAKKQKLEAVKQKSLSYDVIFAAFAVVANSSTENALKWGYCRKLTELLTAAGEKLFNMQNIFQRIFICLKIKDFNFGPASFIKSTYETAKLLVCSKDAPLLSGANEFNGIKWFNKEGIEETLWFVLKTVAMYNSRTLREQIYRLYRTLNAAKECSEYKCDEFLKLLEPPKKILPKKNSSAKNDSEKSGKNVKKSVKK